jgi:ATP-dependent RNA helicase RhlE
MLTQIEKLIKQVIEQQVLPGYEHNPKFNHSSKAKEDLADAEVKMKKKTSNNKKLSIEKAKLRAIALGKKRPQ